MRKRRGGPRGKSNGNERGSAADRRARKLWLLHTYPAREKWWAVDAFAVAKGVRPIPLVPVSRMVEGKTRCYSCGSLLGLAELTVDRIVPGARGGTYVRENIRPCCDHCNSASAAQAKPTR